MTTQSIEELTAAYQWQYRPRLPERPAWFTAWPNGARMAVSITNLHEWESVPRPIRPMPANTHHNFDVLALGAREYGARYGFPRLLDVLDRHALKATVICSGLLAELFPEGIRDAQQRGHELATHGWDQAIHPPVFRSAEEERASLDRALAALEQVTGQKTLGYMSQGPRPTPHTLDLIAEKGFVWTCDYADSDVPYIVDVNGVRIVSVGYAMPAYVDTDLVPLGLRGALCQLTDEFDATYAEAARHPMKFRYVVHAHIGGRPGMAKVLDDFLGHVRHYEDVWFCRNIDMANFWLEH
jgi:peptidoglycan/xylan/chitin deacetylase (PgdA/CDA1 family)